MSCPLYLSYLILQVRGYTSLLRMGQLKLRKVTQPLQSFTANKCQTRLLNWGYLLPKPGLYTSGLNHLAPARKWAANHRNFDSLFALGPPSSQSGIPLLLFQLVGTFHTWSTLCTHSDYPVQDCFSICWTSDTFWMSLFPLTSLCCSPPPHTRTHYYLISPPKPSSS